MFLEKSGGGVPVISSLSPHQPLPSPEEAMSQKGQVVAFPGTAIPDEARQEVISLTERLRREVQGGVDDEWIASLKVYKIDPEGKYLEMCVSFERSTKIDFLRDIRFLIGTVSGEIYWVEQNAMNTFWIQLRPVQPMHPWWKFWEKRESVTFFPGVSYDHAPRMVRNARGEYEELRPAEEHERTLKLWTETGLTYTYVIDPE